MDEYKAKLEAEKAKLQEQLTDVAVPNPENPADWDARGTDSNERSADPTDFADNLGEEMVTDSIVSTLENRMIAIDAALGRIADGSYGICTVGGEEIEEGRLAANPAAETCVEHMD